MSDQPIEGTMHESTQHSLHTDVHVHDKIPTRSHSKRASADPHFGPRGHRDMPIRFTYLIFWLTSRFKLNIFFSFAI